MAAKKTKASEVAPPVATARPENKSVVVGGIAISDADRELLGKSIDDRMAALLEDHKRMGVRS